MRMGTEMRVGTEAEAEADERGERKRGCCGVKGEGGRKGSLRDTRCEGTAELGTIDLEREKGGYNNGIGIGILEWL